MTERRRETVTDSGRDGVAASDYEWVRHEGVTVIECPGCGFSFDEGHTDMDGGYTCPACNHEESELAQALRESARV